MLQPLLNIYTFNCKQLKVYFLYAWTEVDEDGLDAWTGWMRISIGDMSCSASVRDAY
jgi:hypothetical protein